MRDHHARTAPRRAGPAGVLALVLLGAGCSAAPGAGSGEAEGAQGATTPSALGAPLETAVSDPREDSLYPDVGDPGVDALHYDLDLAWDPDRQVLEGREVLTFRAAATAPSFRLDLGSPLRVGEVLLDGEPVPTGRDGDALVVEAPVELDDRHELALTYTGTPVPIEAPSARADFTGLGWHTTASGETWTMQEPYGAHTWYAVNDHPSDKALYDISVEVPSPWVGVANGELLSREEVGGTTRTEWSLDQPAASYLVTVATGELELTEETSPGGTPVSYWTPPGFAEGRLEDLRVAPEALTWLEERLGPYPYGTLGFLVVDSRSGMETQTMITLGDTAYTTSEPVVVHELVHQWYGDTVGPADWSELWMNEGMAMYLQLVWESEHGGRPLDAAMADIEAGDQVSRQTSGPPAAFDELRFGDGNVYYLPALMWHELRADLGDEAFWAMVRAWPAERDDVATDREDYWAWLEGETGEELTAFLEAWLLGRTTPPTDTVGPTT